MLQFQNTLNQRYLIHFKEQNDKDYFRMIAQIKLFKKMKETIPVGENFVP